MKTLSQLVAAGLLTELSYMTADQAADAIELEAHILAQLAVGADMSECAPALAAWTIGAAL